MLINETACEDMRIETARALATGEEKGEEYVSRTVRDTVGQPCKRGRGHLAGGTVD
jgi:hypothetical protein